LPATLFVRREAASSDKPQGKSIIFVKRPERSWCRSDSFDAGWPGDCVSPAPWRAPGGDPLRVV
jgi:hypothetical protein